MNTRANMLQSKGRALLRAFFFVGGLALIAAGALMSLPPSLIRLRILAVILGMLLYMTALMRPFEMLMPSQRKFTALREETDKLLTLVRELNKAAVQARSVGYEPTGHLEPIVQRMHKQVDRLPLFAGQIRPAGPPRPDS